MGPTAEHLSRLRGLCMSLPEVEERVSHGEPAWFIRGKRQFLTYADHHHDERVAFWCSAPEGAQQILTSARTRIVISSRPTSVDGVGWGATWTSKSIGRRLEEIIVDAYVTVAPARLAAQITED